MELDVQRSSVFSAEPLALGVVLGKAPRLDELAEQELTRGRIRVGTPRDVDRSAHGLELDAPVARGIRVAEVDRAVVQDERERSTTRVALEGAAARGGVEAALFIAGVA